MRYTKDFQDPRVLGNLLLPWHGEGDKLEFRDVAASRVWARGWVCGGKAWWGQQHGAVLDSDASATAKRCPRVDGSRGRVTSWSLRRHPLPPAGGIPPLKKAPGEELLQLPILRQGGSHLVLRPSGSRRHEMGSREGGGQESAETGRRFLADAGIQTPTSARHPMAGAAASYGSCRQLVSAKDNEWGRASGCWGAGSWTPFSGHCWSRPPCVTSRASGWKGWPGETQSGHCWLKFCVSSREWRCGWLSGFGWSS